jgi:O-antigen ligase
LLLGKKRLLLFSLPLLAASLVGLLFVSRSDFLSLGTIEFAFGCFSLLVSSAFLVYSLKYRRDLRSFTLLDGVYGAVVVITILSFLILSKRYQVVHQTYVVFAAFVFYLFLRLSYGRILQKKRISVAWLLIGIAGIEAVHGLAQLLSGTEMRGYFFNVNHFSLYLALNFPLSVGFLWTEGKKRHIRPLLLTVIGLLLACIIFSGCRSSYVALLLTLPLMFFFQYRRHSSLYFLRKSIIVLLLVAFAAALVFGVGRVNSSKSLSVVGRILVWKVSLTIFSEHPLFGIGFNNFQSLYDLYQGRYFGQGMGSAMEQMSASHVPYAFNDYLETALEFGALGTVLFCLFWLLILKNVWRVFQRAFQARSVLGQDLTPEKEFPGGRDNTLPKSDLGSLTMGMAGTVLVYMIVSFFYYPSRILPLFLLFQICLASIVSENQHFQKRKENQAKKNQPEAQEAGRRVSFFGRLIFSRRFLAAVVSSLSLLISLLFIPLFFRQAKAEREWESAASLVEKGQIEKALKIYRRAYPALKWNGYFFQNYGKVLLESGREEETIQYLEEGKSFWPNPFLDEDLAEAYRRTGNLAKAVENALTASHILPWRLTSKFMLANLYVQQGNIPEAIRYAQLVVDTPLKAWTLKGEELKAKALCLKQGLPGESETAERYEDPVSFLPAEYRVGVKRALNAAGENARQLIQAIFSLDSDKRKALAFLLTNMPDCDLKTLSMDFLLSNIKYAFRAREQLPYAKNIPENIFLNDVLPYASLNEYRHNWRPFFYRKFMDIARRSSSTEEAALALNHQVFSTFGIRFRVKNMRRTINSPFESINKGSGSCDDLSLLLVDACRAVGIPARIVVIPRWPNSKAGHVWVEIYDNGSWYFMTAHDPARFDLTWFKALASRTDPSKAEQRIYAASFKKTGIHIFFGKEVSFVDVTQRYLSSGLRE